MIARETRLAPVILASFGTILTLIVSLGIVSWFARRQLEQNNQWVIHTFQVIGSLKSLEKSMVDAETGQRGFLFANREKFLEPYIQGEKEVEILIEEIRDLTSDNPTQQRNIDKVERLIDIKLAEITTTIELKRDGREQELIQQFTLGEGKRNMDDVRAAIGKMIQIEKDLLLERSAEVKNASQLATLISFVGTAGAILLGFVVLVFIHRQVVRPIAQTADRIGTSSDEIASTVEHQAKNASVQAAVANQTSVTMDELGISSQQSAEQAESAASGAKQALELAEGGVKAVDRTLQGMDSLREKVTAIVDRIALLSEKTNQIGNVADLVSDLANQTNMLALNASVEAVRAGEYGKGFAVVSAEIRKLADRSKNSTEAINTLVNDIQGAIASTMAAADEGARTVEKGVRIAEETARAFAGVTNAVNNVALNSQQISLNIGQQADAIQQVLTAMDELARSSQEAASGIEQIKEETYCLNESSIQLKKIV